MNIMFVMSILNRTFTICINFVVVCTTQVKIYLQKFTFLLSLNKENKNRYVIVIRVQLKKSLSKEVAFGVRVQTCAKLNQVNQSISSFKKYYSTQSVLLD